MGVGEDLNVLPLSDSNVGYIESVLRTLLEGDSADSGDSGESDESVGDEVLFYRVILLNKFLAKFILLYNN